MTPEDVAQVLARPATLAFVPAPGEVFLAFQQASSSGQKPLEIKVQKDLPDFKDRARAALLAGKTVTDFLVAVQNRNAEDAVILTDHLLRLADRLGMGEIARSSAAGLSDAITKAKDAPADKAAEAWDKVREIISKVDGDLRNGLADGKADRSTADMVALGAWLEVIAVISAAIQDHPEMSGILRLGAVAAYFAQSLSGIGGQIGSSPLVPKAVSTVQGLKQVLNIPYKETFTREALGEMQRIASGFLAEACAAN